MRLLILLILGGWITACNSRIHDENEQLIKQAKQLLEQNPDSALVLLDSVNAMPFNDAEKAEYTLLRVQAKDMAGQDISTDSEIFRAREFFINGKDKEKAALACFYSAKVAEIEGNATDGMKYYQETMCHAEKAGDKTLQGKTLYNMGCLNDDERLYDNAISLYKQALHIFRSVDGQYRREIYSLIAIGNSFMADERQDSAMVYYNEALGKAQLCNDPDMQVMICNNMGVAYNEQGKYDTAERYCRQALHLATGDNEKAYIYRNLADVFYRKDALDSVRFYLAKTELLFKSIKDMYALASLTQLRYQIEESSGNYRESLAYCKLYAQYQKEISDQQDRQALLEMQKKYDLTAKENEYNKEINKWWKIAAGLVSILLVLAVVYIRARMAGMKQKIVLAKAEQDNRDIELALAKTGREKQEKELALEKVEREKKEKELAIEKGERESAEKELALEKAMNEKKEKELELEKAEREKVEKQWALEKMERENDELKGALLIFQKRDNEMQTAFLEKVEIIKDLVRSSQHMDGKGSAASQNFYSNIKAILNKLTEQKFIQIANELHPEFTDKLATNFPDAKLKQSEICVCCLLVCGFNNEELSVFMKKSGDTIEKCKNSIRHKLGVPPYGDILKFILEKIRVEKPDQGNYKTG